ncbi:hypothetical protein GALMADRAFT_148241 [Galerina marginata CBS 339.88]|uniref:Uncharacterized protein n=1 Tax=Galerina marginata (strain CBS 339.88) TaxID=685588 RepID=A0A067SGV4_GALM3|nr:hypothetical protein GALMADRAFT_148241 [Galerina marginata CBS 339.88]
MFEALNTDRSLPGPTASANHMASREPINNVDVDIYISPPPPPLPPPFTSLPQGLKSVCRVPLALRMWAGACRALQPLPRPSTTPIHDASTPPRQFTTSRRYTSLHCPKVQIDWRRILEPGNSASRSAPHHPFCYRPPGLRGNPGTGCRPQFPHACVDGCQYNGVNNEGQQGPGHGVGNDRGEDDEGGGDRRAGWAWVWVIGAAGSGGSRRRNTASHRCWVSDTGLVRRNSYICFSDTAAPLHRSRTLLALCHPYTLFYRFRLAVARPSTSTCIPTPHAHYLHPFGRSEAELADRETNANTTDFAFAGSPAHLSFGHPHVPSPSLGPCSDIICP